MDIKKLKQIVQTGESGRVEFKKTTGQRTVSGKTVCAFLTGQGGHLFFGVTDKGDIIGQDIGNRTLNDLTHELNKIDPPVSPDISTIQLDKGKSVIIVAVERGDGPFTFDGRPYERMGSSTRVMARQPESMFGLVIELLKVIYVAYFYIWLRS
ncbi:helix-turn-helix domain-containing protein [Thermodesulfobacteriota bacterium]